LTPSERIATSNVCDGSGASLEVAGRVASLRDPLPAQVEVGRKRGDQLARQGGLLMLDAHTSRRRIAGDQQSQSAAVSCLT
jgi:hypothetical protein